MSYVIGICLFPPALITLCFALEIFFGLLPLPMRHDQRSGDARGVIVVPAHDEAKILPRRLDALKSAVGPMGDRISILIVADNCMDATARIARSLGVKVIERFDEKLRGKGYALEFAKHWLTKDPPDVVMIVDADCLIDTTSIDSLLSVAQATGSPCQAINLQRCQAHAPATVQVSTFAFFVKNVIRQRALVRLGGRAQLLGTGMAFPWRIFAQAPLATPSIVEDMKLGHELTEAGSPPQLVEEAVVWSDAETAANTLMQRRRWEGGFIREAMLQGPSRLIRQAQRRSITGMWAALSVMIPPFALLLMVDLALLVAAETALWYTNSSSLAAAILAAPLFLAIVGLALAWCIGGRRFVSLPALLRAPLYLIWKIPLYTGFARGRVPDKWVRTDRG